MRTLAAILVSLALTSGAQKTVDRLAVSIDRHPIFESEILDQIRVVAFLEDREPDYSRESRRRAADRLIELTLIRREMEISRFTAPAPKEALPLLAEFRKEQYRDDEKYTQALEGRNLREDDVLSNLLAQLTLARFIEFRFRPGVRVDRERITEYYRETWAPEWEKAHPGAMVPPLDDAFAEIEEKLAEEEVDVALDDWLKATRATSRIIYRAEVFE